MATQQIINIGATPNDQQGDPLRVAFGKVNDNFANLFASFVNTSNTVTTGNTAGQVIFETPANTFTQGQFFIRSSNPATIDSQDIQLYAQLNNDGDTVKFTGSGSSFFGNAVSTYDMDVSAGNVRILVNPLTSSTLSHFIASQVLWIGNDVMGMNMLLDGYTDSVMDTENNLDVTSEQP